MKLPQFISTRAPVEEDKPFVFATYLKRNWFDKNNSTTLSKDHWMVLQHKKVESILEAGNVVIACLTEDPDTIVAYGLKDNKGTFVYVKLAWRVPGLPLEEYLKEQLA